jgi:hypothetical protein
LAVSGSQILLEKLQKFKPKIAVFNGKLIYEVFSGKKDFNFGRQPGLVDGTNTVSSFFIYRILFTRTKLINSVCMFFPTLKRTKGVSTSSLTVGAT